MQTINFRNASHLDIAELLRNSTEWQSNGSVKATRNRSTFGRLPREYHPSASSADYLIYSYATPIAWREEGQWVTPDVSYSPTTSRQQSKIFAAIKSL